MRYRPLGRTPFQISEFIYGAGGIGGLGGDIDEGDAHAIGEERLDHGRSDASH